jgi:hypothetical protein
MSLFSISSITIKNDERKIIFLNKFNLILKDILSSKYLIERMNKTHKLYKFIFTNISYIKSRNFDKTYIFIKELNKMTIRILNETNELRITLGSFLEEKELRYILNKVLMSL